MSKSSYILGTIKRGERDLLLPITLHLLNCLKPLNSIKTSQENTISWKLCLALGSTLPFKSHLFTTAEENPAAVWISMHVLSSCAGKSIASTWKHYILSYYIHTSLTFNSRVNGVFSLYLPIKAFIWTSHEFCPFLKYLYLYKHRYNFLIIKTGS